MEALDRDAAACFAAEPRVLTFFAAVERVAGIFAACLVFMDPAKLVAGFVGALRAVLEPLPVVLIG